MLYDLVAVIHHMSKENVMKKDINEKDNKGGLEERRGHYLAFTRIDADLWCSYDDDKVTTVSSSKVLTKDAYILSYAKRG